MKKDGMGSSHFLCLIERRFSASSMSVNESEIISS
jgi:hypothetical protein